MMTDKPIVQIPNRELWLDDGVVLGREWRKDDTGGWALDPEPRTFSTYGEALDWMWSSLKN